VPSHLQTDQQPSARLGADYRRIFPLPQPSQREDVKSSTTVAAALVREDGSVWIGVRLRRDADPMLGHLLDGVAQAARAHPDPSVAGYVGVATDWVLGMGIALNAATAPDTARSTGIRSMLEAPTNPLASVCS